MAENGSLISDSQTTRKSLRTDEGDIVSESRKHRVAPVLKGNFSDDDKVTRSRAANAS